MNGIEKIFNLLKRHDLSKGVQDTAALCLGKLFKGREVGVYDIKPIKKPESGPTESEKSE